MKANRTMCYPLALLGALFVSLLDGNKQSVIAAESTHPRPNIILVLIDDMGWGDFSCFGNKEIQTTNIDRLASEGLRFQQFYVNSPICSPSRVALSTGQYPTRWQVTSFLNSRIENKRRGMAQWLDPKAPMLARILHNAGYATGHFGKWHMGGQRDVGDAPLINQYGFEKSLTNFEGLGPRILPLLDAYDGKEPEKYSLGSDALGHGPIHWVKRDKVTASHTEAAIAFIDEAQSGNRPFYVNLWPDDVHSPFFPPKARRGDASKHERYLGVLKTLDEQLAPLFNRIRNDKKLRDNTLILVCSDNGPEDGAGSAGPFRGLKGMLYEGGIRSPLVVWGPGFVARNKIGATNASSLLAAIDLAPSLLKISGVSPPTGVEFDGESRSDVLLDCADRPRNKPLFFRRPPDRPRHNGEGNLPDLAVRDGHWKLLCEYDGSDPQLYKLDTDPRETSNLAATNPAIVERLTTAVLDWNNTMPADKGATYTALGNLNGKSRSADRQRN
jgi:arylsulfatase A-like enzyme